MVNDRLGVEKIDGLSLIIHNYRPCLAASSERDFGRMCTTFPTTISQTLSSVKMFVANKSLPDN